MIPRLVVSPAGYAMVRNPIERGRGASAAGLRAGPSPAGIVAAGSPAGLGWRSGRSTPRATASSPGATVERQRLRQPYPNVRVIVLNDDVNTFQHVVDCLVRHLPGMQPDHAWELAHRIDGEGSAVVWRGPQEPAELYHQLLGAEGLTMAPLERD
jgi:ATP-dependent Clp protease adaptor protein ClpS